MAVDVFRFQFTRDVPLDEAEMTLHLAMYAIEGLYGVARVRLDVSYYVDEPRRVIIVDGTKRVGAALVRVFANLLVREFGDEAFEVRRVDASSAPRMKGRAA